MPHGVSLLRNASFLARGCLGNPEPCPVYPKQARGSSHACSRSWITPSGRVACRTVGCRQAPLVRESRSPLTSAAQAEAVKGLAPSSAVRLRRIPPALRSPRETEGRSSSAEGVVPADHLVPSLAAEASGRARPAWLVTRAAAFSRRHGRVWLRFSAAKTACVRVSHPFSCSP